MKVQVLVRLKAGVLDVQGKAVERALTGLGHQSISQVRIGKLIELTVQEKSVEAARAKVEALCAEILTNPIIESYEIVFAKDSRAKQSSGGRSSASARSAT